ncbi:hypothetical protein [Rhizobium sp. Root482]|uniref:hypothetical protein n=1 Tax=Rhizobium sp. Root482 TaxID=1736543 RepID=UPI000AE501DD|nr:hypothetical protein [Rhizobium sp. Root482]
MVPQTRLTGRRNARRFFFAFIIAACRTHNLIAPERPAGVCVPLPFEFAPAAGILKKETIWIKNTLLRSPGARADPRPTLAKSSAPSEKQA